MSSHSTPVTQPASSDQTISVSLHMQTIRAEETLSGVDTGYALGDLLGKGGEGEVHAACQLAFQRTVAVKTLRLTHDDPQHTRRFLAEAAITALLEHPNIIPVHDLRVAPNGRYQLVMKRVSGKTWKALIASGVMTVDEHVAILLKVCDAVEFAHEKGVLHRDLKPENVMVGEHGEVLVMDWGCAAFFGRQLPHPCIQKLSSLVGASGTPAYMSPEQARGENEASGPMTDVHLLGACLYHALTGAPPRRGGNVQAVLACAMADDPISEPVSQDGRRISTELIAIAMAALKSDPRLRTQSVADFSGALRRYLEHRQVLELVANARAEAEKGKSGGALADEAYRRAICAVEQAVRLWPELISARKLEIVVGLDAARHAAQTGALRQARNLARAAGEAAEKFGDEDSVQQARQLADQYEARERKQQRRDMQQKRLRLYAQLASAAALVSLTLGLIFFVRESVNTTEALALAQRHLEQATIEKKAREAGEQLAGPALLAQARECANRQRFSDGLPLVDTAIGFTPNDPRARVLKGQLLLALGRRPEAVTAFETALALRADADVAELRRLCLQPPVDVDARLAEVLIRMGASAEAHALNLVADQRSALAIAQLRQRWPELPKGSVTAKQDGTLSLMLRGGELVVENLDPLRGLPISSMDISSQERLRDLSPLAGLPLVALKAVGTGVRDFSPLRGLPLKRLQLGWYDAGFDLTMLSGAPLEMLDAPAIANTDLSALQGMPLKELRLYGCNRLTDIRALRGMPLTILALEATKPGGNSLVDLRPLSGMQLTDVSFPWQQGVSDIEPLRGMPLRRLNFNGTSITDIRPILNPGLRNLAIGLTSVMDLRPLLETKIEVLDFSPTGIRFGLEEVIALPSIQKLCGYRPVDFRTYLAVSQALLNANPGSNFFSPVVFQDGKIVELRIGAQIQNLSPIAGYADLEVLHLTGPISDVRPLAALRLKELVFSPVPQALGLDGIRNMTSLRKVGSSILNLQAPAEFWRAFDARKK